MEEWNEHKTRASGNGIVKITRYSKPNTRSLPGRPTKDELIALHCHLRKILVKEPQAIIWQDKDPQKRKNITKKKYSLMANTL